MCANSVSVEKYAPAFTVKINGQELDADISKIIPKIEITKALSQPDNFSFEVQDQMKGGKLELLDVDEESCKFKAGDKVSINLGYSGNMTQTVDGIIRKVDVDYASEMIPIIKIEGEDKGFRLLTAKSESVTYLNKKDSDIITEIADKVSLQADVGDNTTIEFPEKKKKGDTSYLSFIKNITSRNAGFEFMISEGKLVFRKSKIDSAAVVTLEKVKDILSFKSEKNLESQLTKVTVRAWDQLNKVKIEGTASAGDETPQDSAKTLGSTKAQEVYTQGVEKIITDIPVDTEAEANEIAKAKLVEATNKFIKIQVQCIGTPEIKPGVCVEIKGVGKENEGKYYVEKSTHAIDADKYTTSFNGRSNVS